MRPFAVVFAFIGRMWNFTDRPWWRSVMTKRWTKVERVTNECSHTQTHVAYIIIVVVVFGRARSCKCTRKLLLTLIQAYRWWKHVNNSLQALHENLRPLVSILLESRWEYIRSTSSICTDKSVNLKIEIVDMLEARFKYVFLLSIACMQPVGTRCAARLMIMDDPLEQTRQLPMLFTIRIFYFAWLVTDCVSTANLGPRESSQRRYRFICSSEDGIELHLEASFWLILACARLGDVCANPMISLDFNSQRVLNANESCGNHFRWALGWRISILKHLENRIMKLQI